MQRKTFQKLQAYCISSIKYGIAEVKRLQIPQNKISNHLQGKYHENDRKEQAVIKPARLAIYGMIEDGGVIKSDQMTMGMPGLTKPGAYEPHAHPEEGMYVIDCEMLIFVVEVLLILLENVSLLSLV